MINNNLLYNLCTITPFSLFLARWISKKWVPNESIWINYLFPVGSIGIALVFKSHDIWFALILFWGLFTLSLLDIFYRFLPNAINFSLLGIGLFLATKTQFISILPAILGVFLGYGILWVIAWVYQYVYGQEGIGRGDLKLSSALGAWIGVEEIPNLLFFSSVLGCFFYFFMVYYHEYDKSSKIPLGVFLSIAGMGIFTLRFSSWPLLLD